MVGSPHHLLDLGLKASVLFPSQAVSFFQGTGRSEEEVCNPEEIQNKNKTRKEISFLHHRIIHSEKQEFSETDISWACDRELVSKFSEATTKEESWDPELAGICKGNREKGNSSH